MYYGHLYGSYPLLGNIRKKGRGYSVEVTLVSDKGIKRKEYSFTEADKMITCIRDYKVGSLFINCVNIMNLHDNPFVKKVHADMKTKADNVVMCHRDN